MSLNIVFSDTLAQVIPNATTRATKELALVVSIVFVFSFAATGIDLVTENRESELASDCFGRLRY